jgi:hypothetical protein
LRALFDVLRGSAGGIRTAGVWWCSLLVAAIDGTVLDVPDSPGNAARLGKNRSQHGTAGYPQIRLVALVAGGTRAVIDAVFGPKSVGETTHAVRLLRSLHTGMIVLLDRGFDGNADPDGLFGQAARVKSRRVRWLDRVRSRGCPVQ